VGVKKIGLTYSLVNLLAPLLGGVPACHGCGGLCGHYAFGARTGGSVVLYGAFYLLTGLFLSSPLQEVVKIFPQPVLGVILLFEALALMAFLRDTAASGRDFAVALLTGIVAFAVPQGFVAGLLLGTLVFYGIGRYGAEAGRGPAAG
jgi:MFS superfamily sulfate permease-like transporter